MTHLNDTSWPPLVREPSEVDYDEDEELVCVASASRTRRTKSGTPLFHVKARSELLTTNMTKSKITIYTIHVTTAKRSSRYHLPGLHPMNP